MQYNTVDLEELYTVDETVLENEGQQMPEFLEGVVKISIESLKKKVTGKWHRNNRVAASGRATHIKGNA